MIAVDLRCVVNSMANSAIVKDIIMAKYLHFLFVIPPIQQQQKRFSVMANSQLLLNLWTANQDFFLAGGGKP